MRATLYIIASIVNMALVLLLPKFLSDIVKRVLKLMQQFSINPSA
jgi:hypothetical protein